MDLVSPETGKIDFERLKQNMDDATNIYISRTNGASCGDTKIQLFKGADSSHYQDIYMTWFFVIGGVM